MKPIAILSSAALLSLSSLTMAAPLVDFSLTASQWQPDYSGEIGQGDDKATLDELGFDEDDHTVFTAVLTHPIPVIPNIRLQHTDLKTDASGTLTADVTIDGTTFSASDTVATDLDLTHTDFTLFWSPLNNWVHFDIGLTGRKFNGNVKVESSTDSAEAELDGWIPMGYLGARIELPLTGFYVDATYNTISYDDNGITDYTAGIGYASDGLAAGFIAEIGVRSFELEIDDEDEDTQADLDIDGIYFTLGIQF